LSEATARARARVAAAAGADPRRAALERSLASRFWLRFHMSVMLFAAFGAGFIASYALLRAGVASTLVRWPLGTLVGYIVLFFCMRLWLAYIGVRPLWGAVQRTADEAAFLPDASWSPDGRSVGDAVFRGGGGRSGGGGASGSFGDAAPRVAATGRSSGGGGGKGGFALDFGDGDAFKLIVLIVIVLALAAALGGGVVYLVASAPHLLADVAFGAALTGGIAPAARRVADTDDGWCDGVWKATWKPFAVILIVVVLAGLALSHYFPGAATLGDAFRSL